MWTATQNRGRPQHNDNSIIINDINVEHLSTKTDKYDNSTVYFQFTDPKSKSRPIIDTQANDEDVKLSCIWTTDTQHVILNVKEKWVQLCDELQPSSSYVDNVDFSDYSLDTDNGDMKGYYANILKIKKKKMDVVLDVNDDISCKIRIK